MDQKSEWTWSTYLSKHLSHVYECGLSVWFRWEWVIWFGLDDILSSSWFLICSSSDNSTTLCELEQDVEGAVELDGDWLIVEFWIFFGELSFFISRFLITEVSIGFKSVSTWPSDELLEFSSEIWRASSSLLLKSSFWLWTPSICRFRLPES